MDERNCIVHYEIRDAKYSNLKEISSLISRNIVFRAVEVISHGKFAMFTQIHEVYHVIMNLSFFVGLPCGIATI